MAKYLDEIFNLFYEYKRQVSIIRHRQPTKNGLIGLLLKVFLRYSLGLLIFTFLLKYYRLDCADEYLPY